MRIQFSKYSGSGNDFIVLDNRSFSYDFLEATQVRSLCLRGCGIGADGVLLLGPSSKGHFSMKIFNSDGSAAEMCGNGLRCLVHFASRFYPGQDEFLVETHDNLLPCKLLDDDTVEIDMGLPTTSGRWHRIQSSTSNQVYEGFFVNTGVPHFVCFVDALEELDIETLGSEICTHPLFAPEQSNVNFAEILDEQHLHLRTYERGVYGETLSCGTGACAVAIAKAELDRMSGKEFPHQFFLLPRSQEQLTVRLDYHEAELIDLSLCGPAKEIFQGVCETLVFSPQSILA